MQCNLIISLHSDHTHDQGRSYELSYSSYSVLLVPMLVTKSTGVRLGVRETFISAFIFIYAKMGFELKVVSQCYRANISSIKKWNISNKQQVINFKR